jgi:outer membrane immunogenic protein
MKKLLSLSIAYAALAAAYPAVAEPLDDNAERLAVIEKENALLHKENAALRQRARLESENATLRKQIRAQQTSREARGEPAAASDPISRTAMAAALATPRQASDVGSPLASYAAAPIYPAFSWTGPYAGISLGVGWLHATTATSVQSTDITKSIPGLLQVEIDTTTTAGAFNGESKYATGAVADTYVGHNFQMNNWVTGLQLEGSLGRFAARFRGSGATTSVSTEQVFVQGPGGVLIPGPITSSTATTSSTQVTGLNLNFMVSALGRVGYLFGPTDLAYALVGWTYAGFDARLPNLSDPSFGAGGLTVGLGWERHVMNNWTLKAEYRYTRFQSVNLGSQDLDSSTNSQNRTEIFNSSRPTRFSPDALQVLRVGLTRYFGTEGPLSSYAADHPREPFYYKVPVYGLWTGPYGGLSVGLGGTVPRATTNSLQTDNGSLGFGANTLTGTDTFVESASGPKVFRPGGAVDLFVGYNYQTTPNFVAGVQLEGSVARFNEQLRRTEDRVGTRDSSLMGVPQPTTHEIESLTVYDTLKPNWMLTALARLGYLAGPGDLLYLLGGWTYAGFDTTLEASGQGNRTFTAFGPTVGAGWERQLGNAWSFRAEYRYARFLDRTLRSNVSSSLSSPGETNASTTKSSTSISSDMHLVRLGLARAFGP